MKKFREIKEEIKKMDVPAYLRKQKGEKPLTMSDVKAPPKDSISHPANLAKARNEEVEQLGESGGDVVYKKGDHHIEKYGEDSFALYKDGKKQKFYTSIEAAKSAMNEEVEELDEISKKTLGSYINKAASNIADKSAEAQHKRTKAVVDYDDNIRRGMSKKGADTHLNRGYDSARPDINKVNSRMQGVQKAISRLAKEEVEELDEKNVPTSPEKWAQAKAQAKAKFDVYPSAYANGWAAKKYKEMGGGWKSVSEAVKDKFDIGEYDQEGDMAKSDLRSIIANSKRVHDMLEDSDNLPEWVQSKITKAEDYMSTVANYMASEMTEQVNNQNLPFDPDPPKKHPVAKAGKYGQGYSTARHLARMAMQKQSEKMKKPVKEETSAKAKIVKDVMKKKKEKVSDETFQKDPIISNTQVKM
jgi:hypothetical protein